MKRCNLCGQSKPLTLPPWSWAVLDLDPPKTVENRRRLPAPRFRGRICIHAGNAHNTPKGRRELADALLFIRAASGVTEMPASAMLSGAIVGVVDVIGSVDCIGVPSLDYGWRVIREASVLALTAAERRWWMGGPAYVLANPRKLARPVACRGWQGLWRVPADVAAKVEEQLR